MTRLPEPEDRDTDIADNQTVFSEATLTHPPTSVWYSEAEEEVEEDVEEQAEAVQETENTAEVTAQGDEDYSDKYLSYSYSSGSRSTSATSPTVPATSTNAASGKAGSKHTEDRAAETTVTGDRRVTPRCT